MVEREQEVIAFLTCYCGYEILLTTLSAVVVCPTNTFINEGVINMYMQAGDTNAVG